MWTGYPKGTIGLPVPTGWVGGQTPPPVLTGLLPQPQDHLSPGSEWRRGWGQLQLALECESKHCSTATGPVGEKTKLLRPWLLPAPHSGRGVGEGALAGRPMETAIQGQDTVVSGNSPCLVCLRTPSLSSALSLSLLILSTPV